MKDFESNKIVRNLFSYILVIFFICLYLISEKYLVKNNNLLVSSINLVCIYIGYKYYTKKEIYEQVKIEYIPRT